jgi:hypothetical protein
MRAFFGSSLTALAGVAALVLSAGTAEAKCKRMGFLVNDYGKDGPTKDAQDLLEKHVAEWATQNGVKNYTIGKKDVSCELYLNLIVFDEHTCTASANVCWEEPGAAATEKKASEKKPAEKKIKEKVAEKPAETPAAEAPAAAPASPIETGTLPGAETPAAAKPAADPDAAERAAAAAERAAEAAERAAAAAERAAAASKVPPAAAPSQLEMPGFGAGTPAEVAPVTPVEPKG